MLQLQMTKCDKKDYNKIIRVDYTGSAIKTYECEWQAVTGRGRGAPADDQGPADPRRLVAASID